MYAIYADETLIYDSTLEDYKIAKGSITLEVNKSGSFTFSVYPEHFFYNKFVRLKTVITVYRSGKIVFRGRILSDVTDYWNNKVITCEGELGFLQDSIIRPFDFSGTPEELFGLLIAEHNSQVDEFKQYKIGTVTIKDANDYIARSNSNYESTLSNLNSRLINDSLGGYFYITHGDNGQDPIPTINYLADFTKVSSQKIEFGSNLKNYTKTVKAEDIATAIIPLGAKLDDGNSETEDRRLTIASINDGVDYVYSEEGVALYGKIFKVVTWDNVTDPFNLKEKAKAQLETIINQNITIELTAIDLHLLDPSVESVNVCDYVRVFSTPHNFDSTLLCNKQTIDLLNPQNDSLVLGYTYSTFTEASNKVSASVSTTVSQAKTELKKLIAIKTDTSQIEADIKKIEGKLELKLDTDKLVSQLNMAADQINITGDRLIIDSTNFDLTADGKITAKSGVIGGWTIKDDGLYHESNEGIIKLRPLDVNPNGIDKIIEMVTNDGASNYFYVDTAGRIGTSVTRLQELVFQNPGDEDTIVGVLIRNNAEADGGIKSLSDFVIDGTWIEGFQTTKTNRIFFDNGSNRGSSLTIPNFTNLFGRAVDESGTITTGLGYYDRYRMDSDYLWVGSAFDEISGLVEDSAYCTTLYIPCKAGNVIRGKGFYPVKDANDVLTFWDSGFNCLSVIDANTLLTNKSYGATADTSGWEMTIPATDHDSNDLSGVAYLRLSFSGKVSGSSVLVLTANQEIAYATLDPENRSAIYLGYESPTSDGFVRKLTLDGNGNITASGNIYAAGLNGQAIKLTSNHQIIHALKEGSLRQITGTDNDRWVMAYYNASNAWARNIIRVTTDGQVMIPAGVTTSSDERFKTDWNDLDKWRAFFRKLKPQAFRYTDRDDDRYHLGFSAQAVETALNEAGLTNDDFAGLVKQSVPLEDEEWKGYSEEYGLIYTEFVALMVDMIQVQEKRIEDLETRLAEVEKRVEEITNV